jgi:CRISPR-associated protein Csy1
MGNLMLMQKTINDFIRDRLNAQVEKKKLVEGGAEYAELAEQYQPVNWIADAARRVSQIQVVTHATKFHHPDAKGSCIFVKKHSETNSNVVGTTTLPTISQDVVGNAAALDVYKFLQLKHNDETLLQKILRNHTELLEALPGGDEQKKEWLEAFATIIEADTKPISHELAKQVYFPIDEQNYHLLLPLYPTALVQSLFETIQEERFGEAGKAARAAKKDNKACEYGCRDYPKIGIQTFGGTKPQNISQLNSNRGGKSYLLASCPPAWETKITIHKSNARFFKEFEYQVKPLLKELTDFLKKNKLSNNQEIRDKRANYVDFIIEKFLEYAAQYQTLMPGWSKESGLDMEFKYWLDPDRNWNELDDEDTQQKIQQWEKYVAKEFALWFNKQLESRMDWAVVGDDEYYVWKKDFQNNLQHDLSDYLTGEAA